MGYADHGHALFRQQAKCIENLAHQLRIERRGYLIQQHVVGLHGQGTGNGQTLLLTTGHLGRVHIQLVTQANVLQFLFGNLDRFFFAHFLDDSGGQRRILQYRHVGKGIPLLKHHAQFLAQLVLVGGLGMHIHIINQNLAAVDGLDGVDAVQQSRLAATGAPDNTHHFAFLHVQAHAFEHFKITEGFMDILYTDHIAIFLSTYRP